ncbi:MAG: vitamin K epoxide reductase family protein [Candidatus Dadabacteria bacterium]|nr:vitamin K epoxide reductase family protein [Candidatus Dadabacteria bacterium]
MTDKTSGAVTTALCATGFLLCLYLTAIYYTTDGTATYCSGNWQCNEVLNSGFSKVFGLPASLFGVIGYAAIAFYNIRKNRTAVIALASAGAGFSAYLSWAEFFVIKQVCPFCVASALMVAAVWILSVRGAGASRMAAAVLIAVFSAGAGYSYHFISGTTVEAPQAAAPANDSFAKGLALHLKQTGAVMYGSFRCPACATQKAFFGDHAKLLNYVECHPSGKNADPKLCAEKDIKAYPTWEINDSLVRGAMSLKKLSGLSGYGGE